MEAEKAGVDMGLFAALFPPSADLLEGGGLYPG